eukprot:CAMPEP_0202687880 /NCGR_PEP_ID=MMETSP1385-20130828/3451_1 /ASSEMBLY_ACC=CAM_ASM_000861 /TAXON_ID=933848 /ORGANISM="Elphidium margaritaceum" /LENGTH=510 /DNA_ID=CAMNT_0049342733 /DNA_START=32 /DNA_END=1564 /DNA_ORIENTATION=+
MASTNRVVTVKYGKKKHKNVEIKSSDTFDDIQGIIFSLTQLTPDRQKIIVAGKKVESDEDIGKLIKNKVLITVMGSTADKSIASTKSTQFIEEMTAEQRQKAFTELPPGLTNLGNTCYLNASIQALKSASELKEHLQRSHTTSPNSNTMPSQLGQLMVHLDSHSDAVTPSQFVQYFRGAFPRFATRNEQGMWEQQDADEAYTEIVSALRQDPSFAIDGSGSGTTTDNEEKPAKVNIINELFEGEFESTMVCSESDAEPELNVTDKFIKLQCFIDTNTRHINDGILGGFKETLEKRSELLDRNAVWSKSKSISKLPTYISVQLVRFWWKQKAQKNTKVLRKVIFPEKWDVYGLCNDALKKSIEKYRKLKLEKEDREREQRHAVESAAAADGKGKEQKEKEKEKEKEKGKDKDKDDQANETGNEEKMDIDDDDKLELLTGYYELCGIVTHKGRSANSGHYIGYANDKKRGKWLKFDDDDVTEIKSDDIKQLYGGGDFQMAFLTVFRRIEPDL